MSNLPPRPYHSLTPAQRALQSHYHETVTQVLTSDATYNNHSPTHLPSVPGATPTTTTSSSPDPNEALGGIFPFLSALPPAGHLSLDLLRTLHTEARRLRFPASARETAALVTMAHFNSTFAFNAHAKIATTYDLLTPAQISAMKSGEEVEGLDEVCALTREVTRWLVVERKGVVGKELWERCVRVFPGGEEGTVLLVNFVGLWVWTSLAGVVCGGGVTGEEGEGEGEGK